MLHHLGPGMRLFPGLLNINKNISTGLIEFVIFPSEKYIWILNRIVDPAFCIWPQIWIE